MMVVERNTMTPLAIQPTGELLKSLDSICDAIGARRLLGHDLLIALDWGDAIMAELRYRSGQANPEPELGTWSPNALTEAERMIAEYCAAHGLSYPEFRQQVDAWLQRQKTVPRLRRRKERNNALVR